MTSPLAVTSNVLGVASPNLITTALGGSSTGFNDVIPSAFAALAVNPQDPFTTALASPTIDKASATALTPALTSVVPPKIPLASIVLNSTVPLATTASAAPPNSSDSLRLFHHARRNTDDTTDTDADTGGADSVSSKVVASNNAGIMTTDVSLPVSADIFATLNQIAAHRVLYATLPQEKLNPMTGSASSNIASTSGAEPGASKPLTINQLISTANTSTYSSIMQSQFTVAEIAAHSVKSACVANCTSQASVLGNAISRDISRQPKLGHKSSAVLEGGLQHLETKTLLASDSTPALTAIAALTSAMTSVRSSENILEGTLPVNVSSGLSTHARDDAQYHQIARDIEAMSGDSRHTAFRLSPSNIGQIDVRLATTANGLSIHMNAHNEQGRGVLSQNQPQLMQDIRSHGIKVSDANIGSNLDRNPNSQNTPRRGLAFIETTQSQSNDASASSVVDTAGRFA
jgi:flagellar hook-length control protein FliK